MIDSIYYWYVNLNNKSQSKNCFPDKIFEEYYYFCKNAGFPNKLMHIDDIKTNLKPVTETCSNITIARELVLFNPNKNLYENYYFKMYLM